MEKKYRDFIAHKAYNLRRWSLIETSYAGSGHPTSCLSAADIMATLFFHTMHFNPLNPENPYNDRFILSKGHASALLYAAWKEAGVLTDQDLLSYRKIDSLLEGHPTPRLPFVEAATGSLGMGLSIGLGQALNARLDKTDYYVYVLIGDAEMAEGSVWEAIEIAAHYQVKNLIGIIDLNRLGQSGPTLFGHDGNRFAKIIAAFGWQTMVVDGHSIDELIQAFDRAKTSSDKPTMIIAQTYKGYGLEIADEEGFHGKAFKKEELDGLLDQLAKKFPQAAAYHPEHISPTNFITDDESRCIEPAEKNNFTLDLPPYDQHEKVATRKAFGDTLLKLASNQEIVALDGDVKNSTYTQEMAQRYPDRFFESFVAEQNMVSMAVGLQKRGKIPFVATFGAFFSRAHDQIRMAAIGRAALRLVGSHAGVSIGEDGPSQMALEDIGMMSALPDSIILYPSDAVSCWRLTQLMAGYNDGISYLRTTRAATPIIYEQTAQFKIGGANVVRKDHRDQVCIIAAGITLFQALEAYNYLVMLDRQIFVSIIDLYCVKPLDLETIVKTAQQSGNRILVVEDHYRQTGIGQAVAAATINHGFAFGHLAVDQLPRSGSPEALLALCQIDAAAIVKKVQEMIG